jgi:hypothetical protein
MRSQNLYCKLVQKATADPFVALAAEIDRDPRVRRLRLALLANCPPAKVPPPLFQSRPLRRPSAPPPLPRCHRSQAHRASRDTGGDDDAR